MKFKRPLLLAAGLALAGPPATANEPASFQDVWSALNRLSAHYQIVVARMFVDLTYESLSVEPQTGNLILTNLVLYPELPWDQNFECEIRVDRVLSGSSLSFETITSTIEVSGLSVPPACLEPEVGGMLPAFGYQDGVTAEAMSIDIAYDLPSSAADIHVVAALEDAVDVSLDASFNYIWFRIPMDGFSDDPEPVIYLGSAELSVENRGLYERIEPLVAQQLGDPAQLPGMIQGVLGQMLGGTPEGQAFVQNLSEEVGRFVQNKDRLVVSAAPEGGVYLGPDTFGSPDDVIAILKPTVSSAPMSYSAMVPPADLAAAMAGGQGLDDATKLRVGIALMTGIGAPRSLADGERLLAPLVAAWNGEAAVVLADALAQAGPPEDAYAAAMVALAGGESRAIGIADTLEGRMTAAEILQAQDTMGNTWPEASAMRGQLDQIIAAGDIGALRQMAHAVTIGRGTPRSYKAAYFLASLAAAAGDKSSDALRRRLDQRFGTDDAWRAAADEAASTALEVWTGGLAETIAARAR